MSIDVLTSNGPGSRLGPTDSIERDHVYAVQQTFNSFWVTNACKSRRGFILLFLKKNLYYALPYPYRLLRYKNFFHQTWKTLSCQQVRPTAKSYSLIRFTFRQYIQQTLVVSGSYTGLNPDSDLFCQIFTFSAQDEVDETGKRQNVLLQLDPVRCLSKSWCPLTCPIF
jgi:hypothetical protein